MQVRWGLRLAAPCCGDLHPPRQRGPMEACRELDAAVAGRILAVHLLDGGEGGSGSSVRIAAAPAAAAAGTGAAAAPHQSTPAVLLVVVVVVLLLLLPLLLLHARPGTAATRGGCTRAVQPAGQTWLQQHRCVGAAARPPLGFSGVGRNGQSARKRHTQQAAPAQGR